MQALADQLIRGPFHADPATWPFTQLVYLMFMVAAGAVLMASVFAALVLIAAVAGKANAMTAMGAMIFFWGRVAYAVIYLAGIAWLRTAAWGVSVIGMILIAIELLK